MQIVRMNHLLIVSISWIVTMPGANPAIRVSDARELLVHYVQNLCSLNETEIKLVPILSFQS